MASATSIIVGAEIYAAVGALVAFLFLVIGIDRIDASARGSIVFRPLLIPGIMLLWPLVLKRWTERERRAPGGEH